MCAQAIDLRLALRSALWPSGDLGRILAYLREAEILAEALDNPCVDMYGAMVMTFWLPQAVAALAEMEERY